MAQFMVSSLGECNLRSVVPERGVSSKDNLLMSRIRPALDDGQREHGGEVHLRPGLYDKQGAIIDALRGRRAGCPILQSANDALERSFRRFSSGEALEVLRHSDASGSYGNDLERPPRRGKAQSRSMNALPQSVSELM